MSDADTDRAIDVWTLVEDVAGEIEDLRRRVQHKLAMMPVRQRRELEDVAGLQLRLVDMALRQAKNSALKISGTRPRPVLTRTRASRA